MPEENIAMDLYVVLDLLEDRTLNKPLARSQNYRHFQKALDSNTEMSILMVDRLLAVCVQDLQEDKQYSLTILKIINVILKKTKPGDLSTLNNLLTSILEVLNIIKTTAFLNNVETLQALTFETVVSYPDFVLIDLATLHADAVMEVLNLYCHERVPLTIRCLPCLLVYKILQVLPKEKKIIFLKSNLRIWFTKLIPTIMGSMVSESISVKPLETLEALSDGLVHIDYADDVHWHTVLECIYNSKTYPQLMKNMLLKGSKCWHRLWIVFIKLLKHQITRITNPGGSPINSMLPVVETAFKMDVANRCRAFQCWDILISNFHKETNEAHIVKRLRLLIIPLKSNNAKVEETILAKLNTWWHLLRCFHNKMDKFIDEILISFLHFCFGKHNAQNQQALVPCLLTDKTKKRAVEAFIEIAGHLNCSGCVDFPKLNGRVVSKKILVDYWNDWVHSLKVAIKICTENVGVTLQQTICLLKLFVQIIGELPDNNIRRDLFDELLASIETMAQGGSANSEIKISLVCSLFGDGKVKPLLKNRAAQEGPIFKIIKMLMAPSLNEYYRSKPIKEVITRLKPSIQYIIIETLCTPEQIINWISISRFAKDNVSILWTAFCEVLLDMKYNDLPNLDKVLLWPWMWENCFIDATYSSFVWYELFEFLYPKAIDANVKLSIIPLLWSNEVNNSNLLLKVCGAMVILKYALAQEKDYDKSVELLMETTNRIESYKQIKNIAESLICILISVMEKRTWKIKLGKNTMRCVSNMIKLITNELQQNDDVEHCTSLLQNLLKGVVFFFSLCHKQQSFLNVIADELLNLVPLAKKQEKIKICILPIMKTCFANMKEDGTAYYNEIKTAIDHMECNDDLANKTVEKHIETNEKFTTPDAKIMTRKGKRKEANIVNTVVENGEEFIVVKSNWKFNPRKLTENQKEKLQRKREDIPALYQDLSQSQDEFKLISWKTDSQDSSSTNSKSSSISKSTKAEDISNILKNIPSSEVVPKILENNFSVAPKEQSVEANTTENSTTKVIDTLKQTTTPKDAKSPRMALKDRVFRNVRNLIEKAGVQKDNKDLSESLVQIENIPKTPPSKSKDNDNSDLIYSAPAKINSERPSRVKRKPKKFDDTEIFALKRSRRTSSQSESQHETEISDEPLVADISQNNTNDSKCNTLADNELGEKVLTESVNDNVKNTVSENDRKLEVSPDKTSITPLIKGTYSITDDKLNKMLHKHDESTVCENNLTGNSENPSNDTELLKIEENTEANLLPSDEQKEIIVQENCSNIETATPKPNKKQENGGQRSSAKKVGDKKSRIEKELAIDTVEGHPFLKIKTERRVTRKAFVNPLNNSRRKSLTEKLNKSKSDNKLITKVANPKKKDKERASTESESNCELEMTKESHSNDTDTSEDLPLSEDIIESSQDSTLTTISATSTKSVVKKVSVIIEKCPLISSENDPLTRLNILQNDLEISNKSSINERSDKFGKDDDSVLPQNKTVSQDLDKDSTENMDTEPIDDKTIELKDNSNDVIIINDEESPIVINTEDSSVGSETQEIAEADTQPIDPKHFMEHTNCTTNTSEKNIHSEGDQEVAIQSCNYNIEANKECLITENTHSDVTKSISESIEASSQAEVDDNTASLPYKDEEQRKKDFLNNTLEISPIKTMSPVREEKSPSPETSNDYVVIQLSSPVQSNGEPFEKCGSPEIFTEDKVSPDKRDLSPPREETNVNNNSSPSSSLSLKKNKTQVRSGGRAAQMLGLCVPDRIQTIINSERVETEELKKSSPSNTPARRNLRILYNSVGEANENCEGSEDSENFLKFKRSLPTSDCSPSGPILKRKLAEITDEATVTPASKRKRVSFHDPPVSTTVSVQKYIEPCGIRSPQNSALKRQERQNLRSQTTLKPPKKLDNVFKLDSVLTKTVESFTEIDRTGTDDTQSMSLDDTPAVEIIKNSDLNDTDPLCPELLDCTDPIDVIASDLSSPTMKTVFLKELEGTLATVGDLAKMTELEVNRLCIKAPKVKIAKKVLNDYALKKAFDQTGPREVIVINDDSDITPELMIPAKMDIETQTNDKVVKNSDMQTDTNVLTAVSVQTDEINTCHRDVQTEESGSKSTKDIITTCIAEKPDFVELLVHNLDESSKLTIAETVSFDAITKAFMNKVTPSNSNTLITQILKKQSESQNPNQELAFLRHYICERFQNRDLVLFCSQLLANIHARPS
ncbi:unnamed protein product [Chilo suppressalis]|uniref:Telomere-associated protein Rif1 N-terminal domain-containing protein n=1 Tax=Chilo suppressalis TaxID=168631 RepID=A0ABN8B9Q8_CHISP|nr:unnamed protein product [Chilo suppressalis]